MNPFKLISPFKPCGDQPQAISKLTKLIKRGNRYQTLLGVTGSGKTFTMASVIAAINKPTLVISHNKTLAAQLYAEFKEFFPENAVEYFVSYYDYYQPEAYIPQTDTYIEKDASINERINRMRLAATTSLMSRKDVIVVSSVSCIYNLGSPCEYKAMYVNLKEGQIIERDKLLSELIKIRYERNDIEFMQGIFRVRGDTVEIFPAYGQTAVRVEFFGDTIEKISMIAPISLEKIRQEKEVAIYPAKHFLVDEDMLESGLKSINLELKERLAELNSKGKLLEAQRLESRTKYDLEMLRETGFCQGVENYSRHLSHRPKGSRPYCLIDYFGKDFLTFIDESHVTIPQVRGMYNGDKARKQVLTEYGFRLPSCLDNRPLKFDEFEGLLNQVVFASATPADFELEKGKGAVVEQIIRPTGLIDPEIILISSSNQVDDLIARVKERALKNERVLITTLTKRMSEDLAQYLKGAGIATNYIHSEMDALQRVKVISDLRKKNFDCLVGVNLLREGLDLPEVSLVCVMDADKEGFLRSVTSLIQVAGRAARNINGKVIMYGDTLTKSLSKAIEETHRRRENQLKYNKENNITPRSIRKAIKDWIEIEEKADKIACDIAAQDLKAYERYYLIDELEKEMAKAAGNLQFERAITLRDRIVVLKRKRKNGKKNNRVSKGK
ncbi:MAG: excinuclease ABC subunit UvrB [Candidatus Omnitrophica bacterium]|nr:excinuclease ABC subunit UvrB [Candidatus Omnitrophota bacterium]